MNKRKEIERRWELGTKIVKIPTIKEIMKRDGLSWQEAAEKCIIICGNEHKKKNIDCHRKLNGYSICDGCPKYKYPEEKKPKAIFEWEEINARVR